MATQPIDEAVNDFLREHPEHIPGVAQTIVDGKMERVFSMEATIAFADWTIATGRGDPERAKRFREEIRKQLGR